MPAVWFYRHVPTFAHMAGMNPQMMEAAQKMMSKMSQEDMDRMMQVCVRVCVWCPELPRGKLTLGVCAVHR